MVGHQTKSMQLESGNFLAFLKNLHKVILIRITIEYNLPVDTTKHGMIDIRDAFLSCLSWHLYHP